MIDYKWDTYAFDSHKTGMYLHAVYMFCLIAYINHTFLDQELKWDASEPPKKIYPECSTTHMWILFCCLIYPCIYDGKQAYKEGSDYFKDPWNYVDIIHICMGYVNILMQIYIGTWNTESKVVLIVVIMVCIFKTFFFMRISAKFATVVTMIMNVIADV